MIQPGMGAHVGASRRDVPARKPGQPGDAGHPGGLHAGPPDSDFYRPDLSGVPGQPGL